MTYYGKNLTQQAIYYKLYDMKHLIVEKFCSFIGNLEMDFDQILETTNKLENLLKDLILKQNYKHFILNCLKGFNTVAHKLLYEYMQKHPKITLIDIFDDLPFPLGNLAFKDKLDLVYRALIDKSDLIVFELNNYSEKAVFKAFEYAKSKNKNTIILQQKIV